jgi:hypothetical protein
MCHPAPPGIRGATRTTNAVFICTLHLYVVSGFSRTRQVRLKADTTYFWNRLQLAAQTSFPCTTAP